MDADDTPLRLDRITTRWSLITDPGHFVLRYAAAIRGYVLAILKNEHDAEEVIQEFLLRVCQKGFAPEQVTRGRFRDYLKSSVRNAALMLLRRRARDPAGA